MTSPLLQSLCEAMSSLSTVHVLKLTGFDSSLHVTMCVGGLTAGVLN